MLTGQEQKDVPLATHVSCTVEMVNISKRYDIAVIDEIQMIGDEQRGHSWYVDLLVLVLFLLLLIWSDVDRICVVKGHAYFLDCMPMKYI